MRWLGVPVLAVAAALGGCGEEPPSGGSDPFAKQTPTMPRIYDGKALPRWVELARDGSEPDRAAAAWAIGELLQAGASADGATQALDALLEDESDDVRYAALTTMRRFEILPSLTGVLLRMAADEGSPLAESARAAFWEMPTHDEPALWKALDDPNVLHDVLVLLWRLETPLSAAQSERMWTLWQKGPRDERAAALKVFAKRSADGRDRTAKLLLEPSMETQRAASHALRASGDGSSAVPFLDHDQERVVYWATVALGGDKSQVERLIQLLAKPNPIRGAATNALVSIGKPALGALEAAAAQTENKDAARAAASALARIMERE